jgi:hypothetical protein
MAGATKIATYCSKRIMDMMEQSYPSMGSSKYEMILSNLVRQSSEHCLVMNPQPPEVQISRTGQQAGIICIL